jgi:galactonate dehydratase
VSQLKTKSLQGLPGVTAKITDLKVYVVSPELPKAMPGVPRTGWQWTFVRIDTDQGISGWGEASHPGHLGSFLTGQGLLALQEALIGENPSDIERLWNMIFRRYTYMGSRGFPTILASGVDIALWDIKGKMLGRPVFELLGGRFRDSLRIYTNGWSVGSNAPAEYAEAARRAVQVGHDSLKLDPFVAMYPYLTAYESGQISPEGEQQGCEIVKAIRQAVGSQVEILIDAHGQYNVPTAIRLANRLYDESRIDWFEEPLPPESFDALRQVRERVRAPICIGERLYTRFDFVPVFQNRLADFVMPDVGFTGGISELKKIATMAEAFNIPVSPHATLGPICFAASAQVMMTVPNFHRLEHSINLIPVYHELLTEPLNFQRNLLTLNKRPGLGVDLNMDYVKAHLHPDWRSP